MRRASPRLAFIGAGNMATALVRGLTTSGRIRASSIQVSDPVAKQRTAMRRRFGVEVARSNAGAVRRASVVVLAVKPQILAGVLDEIRAEVALDKLFISIAAGFSIARLAAGLGAEARIVRVMPNTPALLGKGVSVLVRGGRATATDERRALALFRAVGVAFAVREEGALDAVTGLSGSGPAFVYRFVEALIDGGVREGLAAELASELAFRTVEGAAAMLLETGKSPRELREMVSSPGGTTLAGLAHMDRERFSDVVAQTVRTAAARSRELGRG